ncbi:MAG: hypothetical protein JXR77_07225 [Lentisphaeria bacterium]|nr:hypothetical protein [Lentisphaeria bacterium]
MKFLIAILLLVLAVILFVLFGPQNATQTEVKPTRAAGQQSGQTAQTTPPASTGGRAAGELSTPAQSTGIAADVGAVINYGIGATQLEAKKRMQSRLDTTNKDHHRQLDQELKQ